MKAGAGVVAMVGVVMVGVAMSVAACGGSRHVVAADRASVEHRWTGSDGTTITFRPDGSFTADHWPTTSASEMRYQHYEGTWTIGRPTPGWADDVIITPQAPIGDLDIETEVDMVADGTDRYLCILQDPDSICTLGPLRAAG